MLGRRLPALVAAGLMVLGLASRLVAQDAPAPGMARFVVTAPAGRPVVFWHDPGDAVVARVLARTAATFLPPPIAALGLAPDTLIVIVAPSEAAFAELTDGRVPDWGLAVAFPSDRRLVIRSPRLTGRMPVDPAVVLRHELAHLYLADAVGHADVLPQWFHEGFAALYAEEWRWVAPVEIAWARVAGRLTPLGELEESFPGVGDPGIAYVQSMAAVRNLRERGGDEGLARFLARVRSGSTFDAAMRETYGLTLAQYYNSWSDELGGYGWLVALTDERGLWVAIAFVVVLLYVVRRRGIRREIARRRAAEDAALGDPEDHALGVEEQDRYWEHGDDDEGWRGDGWQDDEDETSFR